MASALSVLVIQYSQIVVSKDHHYDGLINAAYFLSRNWNDEFCVSEIT